MNAEYEASAATIVHNAILLDGDPATFSEDVADHWIASSGGTITARGRGTQWHHLVDEGRTYTIDAGGRYLSAAYVDMHCHGAGGHSAEDGETALSAIVDVHREHGTRALALSYVSDTIAGLCRSLARGARLTETNPSVLGLHAEGPFLSPDFKGAHSQDVLIPPTAEAVERILEAADGHLAQITLAPELPGALEAIERFTSAGVKVAVGHTATSYEGALRAFDSGASILTHTFNAMPGIHHRSPGPILAAVDSAHVWLELINDGVHVDAPAVRMVKDLAPERFALITDAMSATGMRDGRYILGALPVQVTNGVARIANDDGSTGSIAGSTLTLDDAVMRAVSDVGMSPLEAVQAASLVPLKALGLIDPEVQSLLHPGMPADCLLLNPDLSIHRPLFSPLHPSE